MNPQAASVSFTPDVTTAERLTLWGAFVRRHIGELEADTFGDVNFDGRLAVAAHRQVKVFGIDVSRHRVMRTPPLIRRDDRGYVKVTAQLEGIACFEQDGRRVILSPGEWSVYDATRPYSVFNAAPIRQAAIFLPRECLTRTGLDVGQVTVRRFTRADHAGRGAFDLLRSAQAALDSDTALDDDLGETLADLVRRAALEREGVATDASLRDRARRRVLAFIRDNLGDPTLRLDTIAAGIGYSKRYLHKLFETERETLDAALWRLRLERARLDFADPAQARRSITEIAFSWGFSSSSHFSRAFRERYGVSPRLFRSMAAGGGD